MPARTGSQDEGAEHEEWIEKETCVLPVSPYVTPERASPDEIQKGHDAKRNAGINRATAEAFDDVVPTNKMVVGLDLPIGPSGSDDPTRLSSSCCRPSMVAFTDQVSWNLSISRITAVARQHAA